MRAAKDANEEQTTTVHTDEPVTRLLDSSFQTLLYTQIFIHKLGLKHAISHDHSIE